MPERGDMTALPAVHVGRYVLPFLLWGGASDVALPLAQIQAGVIPLVLASGVAGLAWQATR